jgi:serine/threonine protein phosphatase PrpC
MVYKRRPDVDEALVLCCDGVWDVMQNEVSLQRLRLV